MGVCLSNNTTKLSINDVAKASSNSTRQYTKIKTEEIISNNNNIDHGLKKNIIKYRKTKDIYERLLIGCEIQKKLNKNEYVSIITSMYRNESLQQFLPNCIYDLIIAFGVTIGFTTKWSDKFKGDRLKLYNSNSLVYATKCDNQSCRSVDTFPDYQKTIIKLKYFRNYKNGICNVSNSFIGVHASWDLYDDENTFGIDADIASYYNHPPFSPNGYVPYSGKVNNICYGLMQDGGLANPDNFERDCYSAGTNSKMAFDNGDVIIMEIDLRDRCRKPKTLTFKIKNEQIVMNLPSFQGIKWYLATGFGAGWDPFAPLPLQLNDVQYSHGPIISKA